MCCRRLILEVALSWWASAGFLLLAGGLLGRVFCLRRLITVREARMVRAADRLLWTGAAIYASGKVLLHLVPAHHPTPWIHWALLLGLLGLDLWPARRFRSWARHLDLDQIPFHTDADQDRMKLLWRLQVALLLAFPLVDALGRTACAGVIEK